MAEKQFQQWQELRQLKRKYQTFIRLKQRKQQPGPTLSQYDQQITQLTVQIDQLKQLQSMGMQIRSWTLDIDILSCEVMNSVKKQQRLDWDIDQQNASRQSLIIKGKQRLGRTAEQVQYLAQRLAKAQLQLKVCQEELYSLEERQAQLNQEMQVCDSRLRLMQNYVQMCEHKLKQEKKYHQIFKNFTEQESFLINEVQRCKSDISRGREQLGREDSPDKKEQLTLSTIRLDMDQVDFKQIRVKELTQRKHTFRRIIVPAKANDSLN